MKKSLIVAIGLIVIGVLAGSAPLHAAAPAPEGFVGIPWGASRDQVVKAMNERGFTTEGTVSSQDQPASTLLYRGTFDGQPCQLEFYFLSNAMFKGRASHLGLLQPPGAQLALYRQLVNRVSAKYGPPQADKIQEDKTNTGEIWRFGKAEWLFTVGEAPDKYRIEADLIPPVMYFSKYNKSLGYIFITYTAVSLEERLKFKEY